MEMLGAITGLIGAGLQAQAQQDAQQVAWANLQFQKQNAADTRRFASATRSDAYGNQESYNEALNKWQTILTPIQNQIMKAGESEQLRSLTEDAARNRRQKERAENTAIQAGKLFQQALAGYKYDQPKSELATRDELTTLMTNANRQKLKQQQDVIAREALRTGKGADYQKLIEATNNELGQTLPDVLLSAYTQGKQQHAQDLQRHQQQYLPEMQNWEQLMQAGGGNADLKFSNTPQEIQAMQGNMASAIQSAMQSGGAGIGGAYNAVASAVGKSPDLSTIANAFKSSSKASTKAPNYSLTTNNNYGSAPNPDTNRQPWDANIPWGHAADYLDNMDYGDWLF